MSRDGQVVVVPEYSEPKVRVGGDVKPILVV